MKKILIVQSIPDVLEMIRKKLSLEFPHLKDRILYQSDFEATLKVIPQDEGLVVIASDFYHDEQDVLFTSKEKDGNRLAEEIKKINPAAKVYIFSTYRPRLEFIDGFYQKSQGGDGTLGDIMNMFFELELG